MRHRKKGKILDRKRGPRRALLRGLVNSLITYEKVKTTQAKAKAIRPLAEKLITLAKNNNLTSRRQLLSHLNNRQTAKKLLEEIGPRYKERPGGYTRIIKIGQRKGDAAEMVQIEFV